MAGTYFSPSTVRSAAWCRDAVETCWNQKVKQTRDSEKEAAKAAYDVAHQTYEKIFNEAYDDRPLQ